MPHRPRLAIRLLVALAMLSALPLPAFGVVAPEKNPATQKLVYFHPDLALPSQARPLGQLPAELAGRLREELRRLANRDGSGLRTLTAESAGVPPALYDLRAGRWDTLVLSHPLVPGAGVGNDLTWPGIRVARPVADADLERAVEEAFVAYLGENRAELGIDSSELAPANVAVGEGGRVVQIFAPRQITGVPVRDSYVQGVVNSGNLVLFGSRNWGRIDVSTQPSISAGDASIAVEKYVESSGKVSGIAGWWRDPQLMIIPTARGLHPGDAPVGEGYHYRLAWVVRPTLVGDLGAWEALVDAHTGDLLAFSDQNEYITKRVVGGIYPISNDGLSTGGIPDGIEQPGHPMPFANVAGSVPPVYTNSAGLLDINGPFTTNLSGKFVKINDLCGPIAEEAESCVNLSLSQGAGTDCVAPAGHSVGDTHSARTGFYEVNRLIEQAKGWVPTTSSPNSPGGWLNRQLTANMNIVSTCNAFWTPAGGTINFYREGPHPSGSIICRNTGEIAAVFDHEWGHGLDSNDNLPAVSVPGEAYADITALLRLNTSCIGRGFLKSLGDGSRENQTFCGGFGDACTSCSGVREIDWQKHVSGAPHDIDWVLSLNPDAPGGCTEPDVTPIPTGQGTGPCGWGTHCEGTIVGEAIWDLLKRDIPCNGIGWEDKQGGRCVSNAAPTIDSNTALEIVGRLFYLAGGGVNRWYQCNPLAAAGENEFGGRLADSGYMQFLAADDDNGLLADGTPHMKAIYDAFNRHNIASDLLPVVTSGCAGKPTQAAVVTAIATVNGANVSWTAVPGAEKYWVFRTEGVHGCNFGKVKVGETTGTTFSETGLLDGFRYFYSVIPVGNGLLPGENSCAGPMSACAPVVPTSPAAPAATSGLRFEAIPGSLTVSGGDGDAYLDNCENGTLSFRVYSEGTAPLTNVRIVSAQSPSHPQTTVTTPLPKVFAPSIAAGCGLPEASAVGTIAFNAQGLANGDTLTFDVSVTADELASPVSGTVSVSNVETSIGLVPSVTFGFENGTEDWTVAGGTFERTDTPPPAASGTWYMKSSGPAPLGPGCDEIRSPKIILTPTSTLSLSNQFVTEPMSQGFYYDRANVGIIVEGSSTRTVVDPDNGRLYNAFGGSPDNTGLCTNLQKGWAENGLSWATSSWSAASLGSAALAGQPVRISVRYGTDGTVSLAGFMFDQVTLTDVHYLAPDAQSNTCSAPPQADLVVSNITSTNNKANEGDKVTIIATVTNQGAGPAGPSTTGFVLDGGTVLGTVPTGGLGTNQSAQVSVQWDTRSVKGQHVITVTADALNAVAESNNNNNAGTYTVTVQGNKVKNGSFEQPNSAGNGPDAWSGSSTGAGNATWSDGGSDGSKSAATSGNGGTAVLGGAPSWTSDPIAVTPGQILTFAASISSVNASSAATAGLVYLGAAGNVLSTVNLITAPLTTAGFTRLQQTVTIPAGVSSVRVKLVGFAPTDAHTAGTVKFDDVGLFGN
jgi:trimeric autotransporter adhesin